MSFEPYNLYFGFLFGLVGFAAWRYGRHKQSARHLILAVALFGFSYFMPNVWWTLGVGGTLTLLLFWP
ncbi:MAG TPA: hypothetical protein VLJ37_02895 [bacterium]|nr:hypothetical protein [bacterium]